MLFTTQCPFFLASGSPRRKELLSSVGIEFEVLPSKAPEPEPDPGEAPTAYALRAAGAKALDVAHATREQFPHAAILSADTIVVQGNEVLGKPKDVKDAQQMLANLCGVKQPGTRPQDRQHVVTTACCFVMPGAFVGEGGPQDELDETKVKELAVSTDVFMAPQEERVLAAYAASGEPMDKAGAYGIQGVGGFMVTGIRGSYTNVVGLPLARVLNVLVEWGVVVPR